MDNGLSFKQGLIILATMVLVTPILMMLIGILPLNQGILSFIGYNIGMALTVWVAIRVYQQHVEVFRLDLNTGYLKFTPLLLALPIVLEFGVTSHITDLIPMSDTVIQLFLGSEESSGFLSFLTAIILAPVLEEVIFRGVVLKGFLNRYNPVQAIVLSSVLFGLAHLNPWQFIGGCIMGVACGWIYWKSNNLVLPMLIHVSNNLFFSLFGLYFGKAYLTDKPLREVFGSPLNQSIAITLSVILLVVIVYILSKGIRTQTKPAVPEPASVSA